MIYLFVEHLMWCVGILLRSLMGGCEFISHRDCTQLFVRTYLHFAIVHVGLASHYFGRMGRYHFIFVSSITAPNIRWQHASIFHNLSFQISADLYTSHFLIKATGCQFLWDRSCLPFRQGSLNIMVYRFLFIFLQ